MLFVGYSNKMLSQIILVVISIETIGQYHPLLVLKKYITIFFDRAYTLITFWI